MKHTPTPILWVYENSKGCRFCGQKLHASNVNPCEANNMPHKDLYTARFCSEYVLKSRSDELLEAVKEALVIMEHKYERECLFGYE